MTMLIQPLARALKYPDPRLLKSCRRLLVGDRQLLPVLAKALARTLQQSGALGLAAPQIGVCLRMIAFYQQTKIHVFVNPRIIEHSKLTSFDDEACLCFPGYKGRVQRHLWVKVSYQDMGVARHQAKFTGALGRTIQHEIDHLDGILINERAIGGLWKDE